MKEEKSGRTKPREQKEKDVATGEAETLVGRINL